MDSPYGHYYTAGGELCDPWEPGALPSPTTILDILPKPELQAWRDRVGDEAANEKMCLAQDKGTRVHAACEQLLLDEEIIEGVEEEDLPYILGFVSWWNSHDVELVDVELFLESKRLGYRGRTDIVAILDGQWWIIDLKTGASRWSHGYQLKMYEQAEYESTDNRCRMAGLYLTDKTKKGWKFKEYHTPLYKVVALKCLFDDFMKHSPIRKPKEAHTWQG